MNLLYSGNAKVFDGILSSVVSIIHFHDQPIHVDLLTMDLTNINPEFAPLTSAMCQAIEQVLQAKNPHSQCILHDVTAFYQPDHGKISVGERFTPYALLRLYATELTDLPDKLLYLDTDTLAHADLAPLYATDITDYEFAACRDYFGRVFKGRNYVNTGVLLLNMTKIRQTKLFERAREMCIAKKMFLADQDALNRCASAVLLLDDKYNHQRRLHPDTVIRHYCNSFRFFPIIHMKNVKQYEIDKVMQDKKHEYKDALVETVLNEYLATKRRLGLAPQVIPIIFSCDDNYIPFLAVALTSLQHNANPTYQYHIHILHTQTINRANQKKIRQRFHNPTFHIQFNDITPVVESVKNLMTIRDYYSTTIYNRLFIANMFPQYDKVLYLDADIVVEGDIAELYQIDIGDNLLGATTDEFVSRMEPLHPYILNTVGHSKVSDYFNSGVLIMNCQKMREVDFENKFIKTIKQIQFNVAPDQDMLNVMCRGKVKYISGMWDKMPFLDDTINENDIKLFHYNLDLKPWQKDNIPYESHFWHYAKFACSYAEIMAIKATWLPERIAIAQKQTEGILTTCNNQAADTAHNAFIKKVVNNIWR
ncbi:MAG: hypothetical protein NC133_01510 [Prevotella sp.]|nr:hypothetical protein [Prevotella sp.]